MRNERSERTDVVNQAKRNIAFIPITVCVTLLLGGIAFAGYLVYAHINNM